MSGNSIIIMPSPCKSDNHEYTKKYKCQCNSIQSGITISGQMCQYQVIACQVSDSMSIIKCHISGVRYQVSSDNMSSTGVKYNMSSTVSDIKCRGSGVKYNISSTGVSIKCQRSGVKYNMSCVSVRYHVSEIRCQV